MLLLSDAKDALKYAYPNVADKIVLVVFQQEIHGMS